MRRAAADIADMMALHMSSPEDLFGRITATPPRILPTTTAGGSDAILTRIATLLEERGAGDHYEFHSYNPVAEPESVTLNKAMQLVGARRMA